jgi:hypothetical protein
LAGGGLSPLFFSGAGGGGCGAGDCAAGWSARLVFLGSHPVVTAASESDVNDTNNTLDAVRQFMFCPFVRINFSLEIWVQASNVPGSRLTTRKRRQISAPMIFVSLVSFFIFSSGTSAQNLGPLQGDLNNMESTRSWWNPFRTSQGYVLGVLAGVQSRGILIHTLEGSLKLGVTSSRGGYLDKPCYDQLLAGNSRPNAQEQRIATEKCTVVINPWPFSNYNQHLISRFENLGGQLILVFYRTYPILPFTNSPNFVSKIYFVDPKILDVGASYEARSMPISSTLNYASGFLEGRIVKASLDGVFRRSFEFIIQIGSTGDVFTVVSLSDRRLFEFGIKAMSTGRYLKVSYFHLFGPLALPSDLLFDYKTNLRAHKIEVLEEPRPVPPAP